MPTRLPGRPRASAPRDGVSTHEEILQASDRLFCSQGYGRTSTHAIAREARISQASLYHHFSGKQDVLLALLLRTVRPSADLAEQLVREGAADDGGAAAAAERLRRLCAYDARLLASGRENTGLLYSLPEVRDPFFAPFHAERERLFGSYRALVRAARGDAGGPDAGRRAAMVMALVESVITRRLDGLGGLDEELPEQIADAALRTALG